MGKRKDNFIKQWGMTPSEWRKRKKVLRGLHGSGGGNYSGRLIEQDMDDFECGGGDENEIDEDSHCDMVTENY